MLALFERMRVEVDDFRDSFREELRSSTIWDQRAEAKHAKDLQRELVELQEQQVRLLNHLLLEEIDSATYTTKSTEFHDRVDRLTLEVQASNRTRNENADIAVEIFCNRLLCAACLVIQR